MVISVAMGRWNLPLAANAAFDFSAMACCSGE